MGQANSSCGWAAASSSFQLPERKGSLAQPGGIKAPEQKVDGRRSPANIPQCDACQFKRISMPLIYILIPLS